MPRTGTFAVLLFLGSALGNFVPVLAYLVTGWKMNPTLTWDPHEFASGWVQAVVLITLWAAWALLFQRPGKARTRDEESRMAAGAMLLFLYVGYILQSFQAQVLAQRYPVPSFHPAVWAYAAAGLVFLAMFLKPPKGAGWPLLAALVFLVILIPLSVRSFPLAQTYSDIFPAIEGTGRLLLQGKSPYSAQAGGYRCCYWPGLWLSFLPSVILNFDPRYLETLFSVGFAFLVWRAMEPPDRPLGSWFLALYFLNPWSLLRQDAYFSAYLLSWGMFFLALRRGRATLAARSFGWGLSCHPFSWALLPVWFAWNAKGHGLQEARRSLFQALGVAAIFLLPFMAWDPAGFFNGIVMHWSGVYGFPDSHFGLRVWLKPWPLGMDFLSLAFLGWGAWSAWRGSGSLEALFQWLTASLGLALLASFHVEHYYYFVPFALLIFHEIARPKVAEARSKGPVEKHA